jgi:hypothetical protein
MELDNDNIIISNIANYNISFYNGNMILKKIPKKINLDDIKKYDFKRSNIIEIYIDNKKIDLCKYKQIIKYLYEKINNINLIKTNTLLNIKDGKFTTDGYNYLDKLGISVQGIDSNKAIKEILNISNICNIKLNIKIRLENNEIINL